MIDYCTIFSRRTRDANGVIERSTLSELRGTYEKYMHFQVVKLPVRNETIVYQTFMKTINLGWNRTSPDYLLMASMSFNCLKVTLLFYI